MMAMILRKSSKFRIYPYQSFFSKPECSGCHHSHWDHFYGMRSECATLHKRDKMPWHQVCYRYVDPPEKPKARRFHKSKVRERKRVPGRMIR